MVNLIIEYSEIFTFYGNAINRYFNIIRKRERRKYKRNKKEVVILKKDEFAIQKVREK